MVSLKWRIPAWLTASLIGLFIVTSGVGAGLAADAVPHIRDRFDALHHSRTISEPAFKNIELTGNKAHYTFQPDNKYYLEVSYIGNPATGTLQTTLHGDTLTVDTSHISDQQLCNFFCFYNSHDLHVVIHAPKLDAIQLHGSESSFDIDSPLNQQDMSVTAAQNSLLDLHYIHASSVQLTLQPVSGDRIFEIKGLQTAYDNDFLSATDEEEIAVANADKFELDTDRQCNDSPIVSLLNIPQAITVNGKTFADNDSLKAAQNFDANTVYNCISVR